MRSGQRSPNGKLSGSRAGAGLTAHEASCAPNEDVLGRSERRALADGRGSCPRVVARAAYALDQIELSEIDTPSAETLMAHPRRGMLHLQHMGARQCC